jgi:hypothetical protein
MKPIKKVTSIYDKFTFSELIDTQTRKTNERNQASIRNLEDLSAKLKSALAKEK